jgi:hypothetical protein
MKRGKIDTSTCTPKRRILVEAHGILGTAEAMFLVQVEIFAGM